MRTTDGTWQNKINFSKRVLPDADAEKLFRTYRKTKTPIEVLTMRKWIEREGSVCERSMGKIVISCIAAKKENYNNRMVSDATCHHQRVSWIPGEKSQVGMVKLLTKFNDGAHISMER